MMWKTILFFILLCFPNRIYSQDEEEAVDLQDIGREYIDVFKTVPTVIEHLIKILQEKPETLEQDDISVFEGNINLSEPSHLDQEDDEERVRDIYMRYPSVARVSRDDVIKQVIKVQEKLEEYNTKRRAFNRDHNML
ncbi:jg4295 [Pararge aegeria aegeria]|uniref:Jg4295 protein n=1 Tax=Pararge aegeria aegeria TaxID=348720 RepID=A0A8S4RMX9_9NEOP|nr:jg4295 [Pararge aegeria aegeria]